MIPQNLNLNLSHNATTSMVPPHSLSAPPILEGVESLYEMKVRSVYASSSDSTVRMPIFIGSHVEIFEVPTSVAHHFARGGEVSASSTYVAVRNKEFANLSDKLDSNLEIHQKLLSEMMDAVGEMTEIMDLGEQENSEQSKELSETGVSYQERILDIKVLLDENNIRLKAYDTELGDIYNELKEFSSAYPQPVEGLEIEEQASVLQSQILFHQNKSDSVIQLAQKYFGCVWGSAFGKT